MGLFRLLSLSGIASRGGGLGHAFATAYRHSAMVPLYTQILKNGCFQITVGILSDWVLSLGNSQEPSEARSVWKHGRGYRKNLGGEA